MTSPFIGEFCEVRELAERGEGRKGGRGTLAGCFLRRNSSGMALVNSSSQVGCSSDKLADCTVQWVDHIQLDG